MIEAVAKSGSTVNKARVICDHCGSAALVTCAYSRTASGAWTPNSGQALRKIPGWATIKGKHVCPACVRARRSDEEDAMPVKQLPKPVPRREPSREQKRQIVGLLEDAYDTSAERYHGTDTDKTLADAIGGGCMPGWVAEIREAMFGPDGGNGEMEALRTELAEWCRRMDALAAALHDRHVKFSADLRDFNAAREAVTGFEARLDAIRRAVGPKAGRA